MRKKHCDICDVVMGDNLLPGIRVAGRDSRLFIVAAEWSPSLGHHIVQDICDTCITTAVQTGDWPKKENKKEKRCNKS